MLAGRPHEAAGNGSPRWMAADPRERVHRTRPTGQLARRLMADLQVLTHRKLHRGRCSASVPPIRLECLVEAVRPRSSAPVGALASDPCMHVIPVVADVP